MKRPATKVVQHAAPRPNLPCAHTSRPGPPDPLETALFHVEHKGKLREAAKRDEEHRHEGGAVEGDALLRGGLQLVEE
eukprot:325166-Chlamydomonas_euryale.AAC.1